MSSKLNPGAHFLMLNFWVPVDWRLWRVGSPVPAVSGALPDGKKEGTIDHVIDVLQLLPEHFNSFLLQRSRRGIEQPQFNINFLL
jgi:hypothetical protein